MSGGRIDVQRLLLEVLLQGTDAGGGHVAVARSVHEPDAHAHPTHSHSAHAAHSGALLHHRLFPLPHQAEHAEYQAGGQGCCNASKGGENSAWQFQQLASGAALLLRLIETTGAVVVA